MIGRRDALSIPSTRFRAIRFQRAPTLWGVQIFPNCQRNQLASVPGTNLASRNQFNRRGPAESPVGHPC